MNRKDLKANKNTDVITCFLTARVDQNCFTAPFKSEPFSFSFDKCFEMRNSDLKIYGQPYAEHFHKDLKK